MNPNQQRWPTAAPLGTLDRLKILASAYRGAAFVETVMDHPFESVWHAIENIETSVPQFDSTVRRLTVTARSDDGTPVRARVAPFNIDMAIDLRRGWCLMSSRRYVVCFAAEPIDATTTRYGHLEGFTRNHKSRIATLAAPLHRLAAQVERIHVLKDVQGVRRLMDARRRP
jgi:hypothetical protein